MERKMCGCGVRTKSKEEMNAELKNDARRIVRQVDGYSKSDREKRAADVKAAFPPTKSKTKAKTTVKAAAKPVAKAKTATKAKAATKPASKTTARATAKPAAKKGPAPAGMSVGRHDGDLC